MSIVLTILFGFIILLISQKSSYALGFVLGGTVSILNFRLMAISLSRNLKKNNGKFAIGASAGYMLRYAIYGIVLVLSVRNDNLNFVTVAFGFLVIKISVIASVYFQRI